MLFVFLWVGIITINLLPLQKCIFVYRTPDIADQMIGIPTYFLTPEYVIKRLNALDVPSQCSFIIFKNLKETQITREITLKISLFLTSILSRCFASLREDYRDPHKNSRVCPHYHEREFWGIFLLALLSAHSLVPHSGREPCCDCRYVSRVITLVSLMTHDDRQFAR